MTHYHSGIYPELKIKNRNKKSYSISLTVSIVVLVIIKLFDGPRYGGWLVDGPISSPLYVMQYERL